ncbi:hypothetical protein K435DRAFT_872614 [Dendrothele bispora CBS 962.96]|uniref:Uncharacterized protein n=1 Tax=Dendrothele bispora (strain CBS 962.96) TaxID=1314807 RepID=A0A4S8L2D5_DENBC|nr:hypothetical protein K435DRAFT_872614 [Dendrothele bispora CBS 962.96]
MVYKYAKNPEGNMAVLFDSLQSKLGSLYDQQVWSKAVQDATDKDGDCEAAMARVTKLAPAFVPFSSAVVPETLAADEQLPDMGIEDQTEGASKVVADVEEQVSKDGEKGEGGGAVEEEIRGEQPGTDDVDVQEDGEVDQLTEEGQEEPKGQEEPEGQEEPKGQEELKETTPQDSYMDIEEMTPDAIRNADRDVLLSKAVFYNDKLPVNVWNHPNCDAWSPWISRAMRWFRMELQLNQVDFDDHWFDSWEELVEVWLDLEDAFRFEEYGEILSSKRPEVVDSWLEDSRDPGMTLTCDWEGTKVGMKQTQEWWADVKPEEEGDNGSLTDWAPLDRISGRKGFFMFVTMMFALVQRSYQVGAAHYLDRVNFLGDWILLAGDMRDTMKKVQEAGIHIPKQKGKGRAVDPTPPDMGSSSKKGKKTALEKEIASLQEQLEELPKRGRKRGHPEENDSGALDKRKTRSQATAKPAPSGKKKQRKA